MGPTETNRLQQKPLETNRIFLMVSIGLYRIFDLGKENNHVPQTVLLLCRRYTNFLFRNMHYQICYNFAMHECTTTL